MSSPSKHLTRLERRFDLVEYLKQYDDVKDHGPNISMPCPMCDKEDKLWVLIDEKVTNNGVQPSGSFVCYYCRDVEGTGLGKGSLALIQWLEDKSFVEALKVLVAGGSYEPESDFLATIQEAFAALEDSGSLTNDPLPTIPWPEYYKRITPHRVPKYLMTRSISVKKAQKYQLGFCTKGWFRNRLVIPIFSDDRLVSFQARYMRKKPPKQRDKNGDLKRVKKTWFPKGTKTGRMLFNYDAARVKRSMIITEDPFSAMALGSRAVATFGTSISQGQLELLLLSDAEELILLWDRDACHKAWDLVESLSEHWRVRIAKLPDARDIDEHSIEDRKKIVKNAKLVSPLDAMARKVRWQLESL